MIKLIDIVKLILEGGNVFDATSPIDKDNIEPTLEKFVDEISRIFPSKSSTFKSFERLGSVGKKSISGDIDLSYNEHNLFIQDQPDFKGWGIDQNKFNELFQLFTKRSKTSTPSQIALRVMIELISSKLDKNSNEIEVDTKSSSKGTIFCSMPQYDSQGQKLDKNVQIDINIGDPNWLRFSYYSLTYEDNIKGLHRTQLLLALFNLKGRIFNHAIGVINKETRENEAKNPEEAANLLNILFKFKITPEILDDYYKLNNFLKINLKEEEYNNLIDKYLKILDSTRADIPKDLQQYWIENQNRLQLTGKYLPDNSELLQYKN